MKIVKSSVRLIGLMLPVDFDSITQEYVPNEYCPEKLIESAGRVCYKSEGLITPDSYKVFIDKINKNHHASVIEHSCASFLIVCDRGISHELVRHRLASYSQESTRYCNYSKDKFDNEISVVAPDSLDQESYNDWYSSCVEAETRYMNMISRGVTAQIARSVLPTCLKTELVMTANFREWKHFLSLRTAPAAHPQMRPIAKTIESILVDIAPCVFVGEN